MWPALAAVTPTHCRGRVQGHIVSGLALGQGMLVRVLQQYQSAQPIPCLARYRSKIDFSNLEGLYTSAHGILKLQQRSNWRVVCDWYVSKLDLQQHWQCIKFCTLCLPVETKDTTLYLHLHADSVQLSTYALTQWNVHLAGNAVPTGNFWSRKHPCI